VIVTSHGRDDVVLLPAEEYRRLRSLDRRVMHVSDLTDEELAALDNVEIPSEAARYNPRNHLTAIEWLFFFPSPAKDQPISGFQSTVASPAGEARAPESGQALRLKNARANRRVTSEHRQ
jgi:PHD/YefM family antitoxin component YafN of YafNO toxin-antitoxin module